MTRKSIPVFIIEEHHEAFIVWNYAIQKGLLPHRDNCLLHIDEHSDMGIPRFNESIHNLNGSMDKIIDFSYRELNIASFIIPACYCSIFNRVYWVKQIHSKTKYRPTKMIVCSYNKAGKRLISGKAKDVNNDVDLDKSLFDYYLRTLEQLPTNKKVVLDIDLDFFSCSGNPNELEEIIVEISKDEHNSFLNNKYHRLNFCPIGKIETFKEKKKYYYVINYFNEIYPNDLKVPEETIIKRISHFTEILKEKKIVPLIIDICRSRHSGYTPSDQWEFIEENLIKQLKEIYSIEIVDNICSLVSH